MRQIFEQSQVQVLSPQVLQAIEILQMDMQELSAYVKEQSQENPLLELDFSAAAAQPAGNGLYFYEADSDWGYKPQKRRSSPVHPDQYLENLSAHSEYSFLNELQFDLSLQLPELPEEKEHIVRLLFSHLDASGYLHTDLRDLSRSTGLPFAALENGLQLIQTLEPPGIGARSLEECLLLQLRRLRTNTDLAQRIVSGHLELIGKNQYHKLAQLLGVSDEKVKRSCQLIRSLNPKPGHLISNDDLPEYIVPDVVVSAPDENGNLHITINQNHIPSVSINQEYSDLLRSTEDREVRTYLSQHHQKASWIVSALRQRNETIQKCTEAIIRFQQDFFLQKDGALIPLSLTQIAEEVGVHVSTVGRALKNKYLQCPRGVYPLRHFFPTGFSSESDPSGSAAVSSDTVRNLLCKIIEQEDKRKPLSDQQIADKLAEQGCKVARRTIAKYRDLLNIPSTAGRREI